MWNFYISDLMKAGLAFLIGILTCFILVKKGKAKKKIIFVWCGLYIVVAFFFYLNGYGMKYVDISTTNTKMYSKKELEEDFRLLKRYILEKNPVAFTNKSELIDMFNETEKKIVDGMTEEEFYHLLNPLVVAVKCGHTNLSISKALVENRKDYAVYFPLLANIEDGKIIVDEENDEYGIKKGEIIKSINGNSSDKILSSFEKNISHDGDNLAIVMNIASKHFGYEYYEFVEKANQFSVELIDTNGLDKKIDLKGEYIEKENTGAWQLHLEDYKDASYYEYKIDGNEELITVNVFFEEKEKFSDFLSDCFSEMKDKEVTRLTIDVRGNFGGEPQMAKELLSYIIKEDTKYFTDDTKLPFIYKMQGLANDIIPKEDVFTGEITLLVDGGCFSTCGHSAAVFKEHQLGKIVGTNTGGGASCTDSSINVVLRNTGIRLHNSLSIYSVVADSSMRNMVVPDEKIE